MTRRDLIALLGSTAAVDWPGVGWAQQLTPLPRVGLLAFGQELDSPLVSAFRDEMRKLGHAEGQTYSLEFRSARGDLDRLQRDAAELVHMSVDVIVTDGGAASIVAKKPSTLSHVDAAAVALRARRYAA